MRYKVADFKNDLLEDELNAHAAEEGWEVVQVMGQGSAKTRVLLKTEKPITDETKENENAK